MQTAALEVVDFHAWQGDRQVLRGVGLEVRSGEVVSLLGPDGSGRCVALQAIPGLAGPRRGSVRIHGHECIDLPCQDIQGYGLAYCHGSLPIHADLSCEDHLLLPAPGEAGAGEAPLGGGLALMEIYDILPLLLNNRHVVGAALDVTVLRYLPLARALRAGADLLLLDGLLPPGDGLPPDPVLPSLLATLRELNYAVMLAGPYSSAGATLADRHYLMHDGRIIDHRQSAGLPAAGRAPADPAPA